MHTTVGALDLGCLLDAAGHRVERVGQAPAIELGGA